MTKKYRRNEDIVFRKIAGELFLIPVKGRLADMKRIFAMNGVAEFIWGELDGSKDLKAICGGIAGRFDVEDGQAASDLRELIGELEEADLIREAGT